MKKVLIALLVLSNAFSISAQKEVDYLSSLDPMKRLIEGNERFVKDQPIHPDQGKERLKELNKGQHPFAVVISCADSRLSTELIFDQGLGDIFTIRNAGNLVGNLEIGSVEYAVEHLHAPLVIVMGHDKCGAVKAFIEHKNERMNNHIQYIINYLKNEKEEKSLDSHIDNYEHEAIKANVMHGVNILKTSKPILEEKIKSGELEIVGAIYNFETGKVEFIK